MSNDFASIHAKLDLIAEAVGIDTEDGRYDFGGTAGFDGGDGEYDASALLSANQIYQRDVLGKVVRPSVMVLSQFLNVAFAIRDGRQEHFPDTPNGRRLYQFMLDNPDDFGDEWLETAYVPWEDEED